MQGKLNLQEALAQMRGTCHHIPFGHEQRFHQLFEHSALDTDGEPLDEVGTIKFLQKMITERLILRDAAPSLGMSHDGAASLQLPLSLSGRVSDSRSREGSVDSDVSTRCVPDAVRRQWDYAMASFNSRRHWLSTDAMQQDGADGNTMVLDAVGALWKAHPDLRSVAAETLERELGARVSVLEGVAVENDEEQDPVGNRSRFDRGRAPEPEQYVPRDREAEAREQEEVMIQRVLWDSMKEL
jgi:hypothetical protein